MHPRERILGYIKYYQEQNKKIPKQVLKEAHKWRIQIPGRVTNLQTTSLTKKGRATMSKTKFTTPKGIARYVWLQPGRPDTAFDTEGKYKVSTKDGRERSNAHHGTHC